MTSAMRKRAVNKSELTWNKKVLYAWKIKNVSRQQLAAKITKPAVKQEIWAKLTKRG